MHVDIRTHSKYSTRTSCRQGPFAHLEVCTPARKSSWATAHYHRGLMRAKQVHEHDFEKEVCCSACCRCLCTGRTRAGCSEQCPAHRAPRKKIIREIRPRRINVQERERNQRLRAFHDCQWGLELGVCMRVFMFIVFSVRKFRLERFSIQGGPLRLSGKVSVHGWGAKRQQEQHRHHARAAPLESSPTGIQSLLLFKHTVRTMLPNTAPQSTPGPLDVSRASSHVPLPRNCAFVRGHVC